MRRKLIRRVCSFFSQQLVEAFIKAGLDDLAAKHIISYWGYAIICLSLLRCHRS